MAVTRKERAYERYAWMLLFVEGIFGLVFALYFIFISRDPDPAVTMNKIGKTWDELIASDPRVADYLSYLLRFVGLSLVGISIFGMSVSATAYRRGEKWAWYALWYFPVFFAIITAINAILGGGTIWPLFAFLLVVSLAGLLLPYRKFFPKAQVAPK